MKNLTFLIFSLLIFNCCLNAQPTCGFDDVRQNLLKQDSNYARAVIETDAGISRYITSHPGEGRTANSHTLYTIPVVVHVIHTGGPVGSIYNPGDNQIIQTIDYLNRVYAGTYHGTEGVGDLQIQFALAQRDPHCNPTTGIVRIDQSASVKYIGAGMNLNSSRREGESELAIKNLSRWDVSRYYNIWVVNKIDGLDGTSSLFPYTSGYAYFPGAAPDVDGLVILASALKETNKTLPHEMAHALGLYHTYEGATSAICPNNNNCNVNGDRVCDTDPVTQSYGCRDGANVCTGGDYTGNTESNYMGFSGCHTLFTQGQKDRMLAAMTLPSRASLAASDGAVPTYSSPDPCIPKVNFGMDKMVVTETTDSTIGCRSYKDYTFYITVSNDPVTVTKATLLVNGSTATEGTDFDITTNESFESPAKVITFPAGTHSERAFTIRIYDDAEIESKEMISLTFSLDNGGGNALPGDARTTLSVTIKDNDILPVSENEKNLTAMVGTTNYVETFLPVFNANLQKSRGQILYTAAQLSRAGITPNALLTGFSFYIRKTSIRPFLNLNIQLAETSVPFLGTPYVTFISNAIRVASYNSYETINGWNHFPFDAPFTWDGISNLVIDFCFDNITSAANAGWDFMYVFKGAGLDVPFSNSFYFPNLDCKANAPLVALSAGNDSKPATEFRFENGNPKNPVAINMTNSKPAYLGPHADIYFYNNRGEILARIKNMTAFDYGCTQVSIDAAGNTSSPFYDNNPIHYRASKSFRVIPAHNNSEGHFQIGLYYTREEIRGWENATGQVLTDAKMVNVSNGFYVPDVTPVDPHVADISFTSATQNAFGDNHVITGEFNHHTLSGFGIGVLDQFPLTKSVRIFPNPVSHRLTVEFPQPASNIVFRIFAADGKLVLQKRSGLINRYETIVTDGLAAGVYLLRIETSGNAHTMKFMKR